MKHEYIKGLFNDAGSSSVYIDQQVMVGFAGSDRRKQWKFSVWILGVPAEIRTGVLPNASLEVRWNPTVPWNCRTPPEIRPRPLSSIFFPIHYSPNYVSLLAKLFNELYWGHGRKSMIGGNVAQGFSMCSNSYVCFPQLLLAYIKQSEEPVAIKAITCLSLPTFAW